MQGSSICSAHVHDEGDGWKSIMILQAGEATPSRLLLSCKSVTELTGVPGPILQRNMRNICYAHVTRWSSRPRPLHWHLCGGILQLPAWSSRPFFTAQSAELQDLDDESARTSESAEISKVSKIRHILHVKLFTSIVTSICNWCKVVNF